MWIKGFQKTIQNALRDHRLTNCEIVVDAQNFFYDTYKDSGLQFVFGCESEKYAQYLRNYLSIFKKANVRCYFILKGGHENFESIVRKDRVTGKDFVVGVQCDDIVMPINMKDVYKQVLDEMEFDYTVCKFESKKECIALAKTLGCAVMSNDIEYCFAGIPYIPYKTLVFNERTKTIECQMFSLLTFLRIHRLTGDKLSIFIALSDQKLLPDDFSKGFKVIHKIWSNENLLKWLSQQQSHRKALNYVSQFISSRIKAEFLAAELKARDFVRPKDRLGVPSLYLRNRNTFEVIKKDPLWFEKGVASGYIDISYVNLYHHGCVLGSWGIQHEDCEDALMLSRELIIYAYNLMTDYKKTEIKLLVHDNEPKLMRTDNSDPKPNYEAEDSVFENGWCEIKSLRLFEHFLENALSGFDYETLENLSEDMRLLMIALMYFSVKKSEETSNIVYSVLLSYIALSVVFENTNRNNHRDNESIPSTTNKNDIFQEDVTTAAGILEEYFNPLTALDTARIFDSKMNHALIEFQHCLGNFNYLNKLCGSPYKPTFYAKTLNGTFVYRILHEIISENGGDGLKFVGMKLNPAVSVLAFFQRLEKYYTRAIDEM